MKLNIDNLKIPITQYELSDSFDDRFKKVKLWVAHTGENLNHSIFEKKTLEKMSDTLPMTPIVGYIEKNEDDSDDFSDHRQKITLKQGDIEYEYMCHAYGFIPEDPNEKFEFKDGKEWLTIEGYLWTKFNKAIEIFEDSDNKKSQSMEIDNVDGYVNDDGNIVVEDARFSSLCVLGDDVRPGMQGSTIQFFSESSSLGNEIKEMMMEFSQKGEKNSVDKDKKKKDPKKVEDDEKKPKGSDTQDPEVKDDDTKAGEKASPKKDTKPENEPDDKSDKTDPEKNEPKDSKDKDKKDNDPSEGTKDKDDKKKKKAKEDKKFQIVYELSHEDIRAQLHKAIRIDDENGYAYVCDVFDDHFIYQVNKWDETGSHYFKASYKKDNDQVAVGEKVEVFPTFLTKEEQDKVEADRKHLEDLETELSELKMEKENAAKADKEKLIESYSEELGEDAVAKFSEKVMDFSYQDLEKEIAFELFTHKKFDKEPEQETQVGAANFNKQETDGRYGDLDRLFTK